MRASAFGSSARERQYDERLQSLRPHRP
jgi:hypothetical protein